MKLRKAISFLLATVVLFQFSLPVMANTSRMAQEEYDEHEFSLPVSLADAQENFSNFAQKKVEYSAQDTYMVPGEETGEKATIVGQVYDEKDNEAVPFATVKIPHLVLELTTDSNGAFEITGVPEGRYDIEVSASGYEASCFYNMPAFASSGAEFYYLPLREDEGLEFDYESVLSDTSPMGEVIADDDESGIELYATPYTLKSYTVNYKGNIYSFGKSINNYLYCVVPNEMVVSNLNTTAQKLEAYKAQAVASRGYADSKVRRGMTHNSSGYSLCAEKHCQKFVPYYTNSNAIQAVEAVNNKVLSYDNNNYRSTTEFHGKCQGKVTNYPNPTDESIYEVKTCTDHSPAVGAEVAHNRGMCQTGAALMAKSGKSYIDILKYYYASCDLMTAYPTSYEGINPGETIRFSSAKTVDFLTYAPVTGNYTIQIGKAGNTSYSQTIAVHKVTRDAKSNDVIVGDLVKTSSSASFTVSLTKGTEYRIRINCTSASTMTAMLSVKCNAANHIIGTGPEQGKNKYLIAGVAEKVFKFYSTATKTYTIETSKPGTISADTYLELRDSNFNLITSNDNVGTDKYSSITRSLTKGTTYYIVVTSANFHKDSSLGSNFQCWLKIS